MDTENRYAKNATNLTPEQRAAELLPCMTKQDYCNNCYACWRRPAVAAALTELKAARVEGLREAIDILETLPQTVEIQTAIAALERGKGE